MAKPTAANQPDHAFPESPSSTSPTTKGESWETIDLEDAVTDAECDGMETGSESEDEQAAENLYNFEPHETIQAFQQEVSRLAQQIDRLQLSLRCLDRRQKQSSRLQVKNAADVPNQRDALDTSAPQVDVARVQALAIALIEGGSPTETAGQLLDEVDRVMSGAEVDENGLQASPSGQKVDAQGRLHELEGVVDVMLARVGALEDDVRDIQSRGVWGPFLT